MPTEEFAISICRHIKANGLRCQSPSLRAEPFCYFHARLHKDHPAPLTARKMANLMYDSDAQEAVRGAGEDPMQIARAYPRQNEFNFPPLEDADSIRLAASMLFHAVAQGQIHLRRARILRDMLRVANASDRRAPAETTDTPVREPVREIVHTSEGVALAPADFVDSPAAQIPSAQEFTANSPELNILQNAYSQPSQSQEFAI